MDNSSLGPQRPTSGDTGWARIKGIVIKDFPFSSEDF